MLVCDAAARYRGYRVPPARWQAWDYTSAGWYSVTICTRERAPHFGRVVDGRMRLSPAGRIVWEEWRRTGDVRPGVVLDAFVVMPDHVHAVIGIADGRVAANTDDERGTNVETPRRGVSTGAVDVASIPFPPPILSGCPHAPRWVPGCLGAIVGRFKASCTRRIRATDMPDFAWQPRFHDAVIRNARHLAHVRRYVEANPERWAARPTAAPPSP